MRILVLADFSCRTAQDTPLEQRKFQRVDIDNFDQLLAKLKPSVEIELDPSSKLSTRVEMADLEELHPDHLYRTLPVFRELVDLRKRLRDPGTFAEAAKELSIAAEAEAEPATSDSNAAEPPQDETDSDMLQRVLGQSTSAGATNVDISNLIQSIVAPHIVPSADPRQDEYVASVDQTIAAQMRAVLHSPGFQAMEARWLSLHRLVSSVAMSEELKVYLWDVTREELQAASDGDQLDQSSLFRRLVTERDQEPWSVIVTEESFGKELEDLLLLSRLGAVAAQSNATLLAGASAELADRQAWNEDATEDDSASSQNWQSIRSSAVAPWIGLSAPRVLARLPYGTATDEIDSFAFEEIVDAGSQHDEFLWGPPAFYAASLIAQSFLDGGWNMSPDNHLELDDLPIVTYADSDGEKHLKACAEFYLPERTAEEILTHGIMPWVSFKNRNAARLLRSQSIASPAKALSGPWSG